MKCPRCGLFNPEDSGRCDCGYDFSSRAVKRAYFQQELPSSIRTFVRLAVFLNIAFAAMALFIGEPLLMAYQLVWASVVYWLYTKLVARKNWARVVLLIVAFPLGLVIGISREARLYCLQDPHT